MTIELNVISGIEDAAIYAGIEIENSRHSIVESNYVYNNNTGGIPAGTGIMLTELKTGNPDIFAVGPSKDSCTINRHRYVTLGVDDFAECEFTNTDRIGNYLLPPVAPRERSTPEDRAKVTYMDICSGCYTYTGRMIGPPVKIIQALYMDNPQGIVDYITNPVKKRDDYPEMPTQDYLEEETRMAVAKYMLSRKN